MHLPHDTALAIGRRAERCDSRSLFISRYADPTAKDSAQHTPRKDWFNALISTGKKPAVTHSQTWFESTATLLRARLLSRLMINMAGSVMENAGLNLDRLGLPLIPGSAVKGCARRAALAALREWCETGTKPQGPENLFTPLCTEFTTPSELLIRLCLVFGWVEQDWSTEKNKAGTWESDFAWASNGINETWVSAAKTLCEGLRATVKVESKPWESLPNLGGCVAFLPASPNRDPGLILDVVTPHHTAYYEGKLPVATDTEEPVPVFFPAVKEQEEHDYFTFPLIPLRGAPAIFMTFAKLALSTGLEAFGIGAKTNAGYGWFDASSTFNDHITQSLAEEANRKNDLAKKTAEKDRMEAEARVRAEAKAALASAIEGLPPEQQEDKKIELLSEAQFDSKVRAFFKDTKRGGPSELEKHAIVRALRGPRLMYWQAFKTKATKGDLATAAQAIRALNKQLHGDKMP